MGDKSKIEWTDATWNPVTGCTKVSQGCKNCYAERQMKRFWPGRSFTDVQLHPDRLEQPLHWKRPRRIFVNSMSDLFHESIPDKFICDVFVVMARAKQHTFQVLTKRPDRMREFFEDYIPLPPGMPTSNVWLGVSCEDQKTANERISILAVIPAATRFISCEPLLGPIILPLYYCDGLFTQTHRRQCSVCGNHRREGIHWIIVGGESGPHARPMHPDWVRSLRDQCVAAEVPFFFKQWGEWIPAPRTAAPDGLQLNPNGESATAAALISDGRAFTAGWTRETGCCDVERVGKRNAGSLLDGREWDQYPEVK